MIVIARNSVFTYKGRAVDVRQVSRELGVRHVLEGSVQKAGDRVRITAQLVDATTGDHLWAQSYDRTLKDIFAVQDEITRRIVTELRVQLLSGEDTRAWRNPTTNSRAYDFFLRGLQAFNRYTRAGHAQARRLFEQALAEDAGFTLAMVQLGFVHFDDAFNRWSESPRESWGGMLAMGRRAMELDESLGYAHLILGMYSWIVEGDSERAAAYFERSIELEPNSALVNVYFGTYLVWTGRPEDGLEIIRKSMRLNPIPPPWYMAMLGWAYNVLERYEEAIDAYGRCVARYPDMASCHRGLAIAYIAFGREEQARVHAREVLRIVPGFTLDGYEKFLANLTKDSALRHRLKDGLRQAGLK